MTTPQFIFTPGTWEGVGTIAFSMAEDKLPFTMIWRVGPEEGGEIRLNQSITIEGFPEKMHNRFIVSSMTPSTFEIEIENQAVGKVCGKGIKEKKRLGWEFKQIDPPFHGFELYELQEDGSYRMKGEYTAGDGFSTQIKAQIRVCKSNCVNEN